MATKISKMALERRDKSQKRQIANLKEKMESAPIMGAASTIAGAAALGAYRAKIGTEILGAPVEPLGAVAVAVAGVALKKPALVSFASGWVAPYIANIVEDSI